MLGAVQRCLRQESIWSTAGHCRQHSHEYLVSSVFPPTGGGARDGQTRSLTTPFSLPPFPNVVLWCPVKVQGIG